jgi:hypothetical protein
MALLLPGCGDDLAAPISRCETAAVVNLCAEGDEWACRWRSLLDNRDTAAGLSTFAGLPAGSNREEVLRSLYSGLEGKELADTPPRRPSSITVTIGTFDSVTTALPIDWQLDPFGDPSWRLFFQSLNWIEDLAPEAGAAVVLDWSESQLFAEETASHSWDDHAIALRVDRVRRLLDRYIASTAEPSLPALWAGTQLVATHLYALASSACYQYEHNHGVIQDRAMMRTLLQYSSVPDYDQLWELCARRFRDQFDFAVTQEAVHVENSPAYHLLFTEITLEVIGLMLEAGLPVDSSLLEAPPRMAGVLARLLQPNLTFAQLGDTENLLVGDQCISLVERIRDANSSGPGADELEWVVTRGVAGTTPSELDTVYSESGYAVFRDSWESGAEAIAAHFTCRRLSRVHYHPDETGFTLYGFGRELIVDPGLLSYQRSDQLTLYSRSVRAHNVLVVDDLDHEAKGESQIEDYGLSDSLSWVRGSHSHYRDIGISRLARTFAHSKPNVFLVVDHLESEASHQLTQRLQLHPELTLLERPSPNLLVLGAPGPGEPTLLVTTLPGATIELRRGERSDDGIYGWWFPRFGEAVEANQVIVHWQHDGGSIDLPLLIAVLPPGESAELMLTGFEASDQGVRLEWLLGGQSGSAELPSGR